jgi:hypothetical protein
LFSWRRVISTTILVSLLICVAYITFEGARIATGRPFHWPFVAKHWETGFPTQVTPAMLSISIIRMLIAGAIAAVGQRRWGTPVFLAVMAIAGYLSATTVA